MNEMETIRKEIWFIQMPLPFTSCCRQLVAFSGIILEIAISYPLANIGLVAQTSDSVWTLPECPVCGKQILGSRSPTDLVINPMNPNRFKI